MLKKTKKKNEETEILEFEDVKKNKQKSKKEKTINVEARKWRVVVLWVFLIASSGFGLYRNFSAINIHTIYRETVVEMRVQSTAGIENFVRRFANEFFTYNTSRTAQERRTQQLREFMTEDLIDLNRNMVTNLLQSESLVEDVFIWSAVQIEDSYFGVTFSVIQSIEDETGIVVLENAYHVIVYVDDDAQMVITRKSFANVPSRAIYNNTGLLNDGQISGVFRNEILSFLELFFEIYPNAPRQQLSFHMSDDVLVDFPVIERSLRFNRLIDPVFSYDNGYFMVEVSAEYFCLETLTNLTATYRLRLQQINNNFMIVGNY